MTWISHGCTCVPHPLPQGHPSAPALSTLSHASNLDWQSISHMVINMFQCYSLKSSRLLPQSPMVCSLHLCLLCCLTYRVIVTIFLIITQLSIFTCKVFIPLFEWITITSQWTMILFDQVFLNFGVFDKLLPNQILNVIFLTSNQLWDFPESPWNISKDLFSLLRKRC